MVVMWEGSIEGRQEELFVKCKKRLLIYFVYIFLELSLLDSGFGALEVGSK